MFICPRCNTQLPNGTRFCPNCGLQFGPAAAAPDQQISNQQISNQQIPGQQNPPPPGQAYPPSQFPPAVPPRKKRNPFLIGCLSVVGIFIVLGIIGNLAGGSKNSGTVSAPPSSARHSTSSPGSSASAGKPAADDSSSPPVISVSANTLAAAYTANEVAADDKYKGKELTVSGTVESIGKDITDTSYVTLAASGDIFGVQCMFDDQYKGQLAKLQKGQRVQLHGTCKGKTLNVILADCVPN